MILNIKRFSFIIAFMSSLGLTACGGGNSSSGASVAEPFEQDRMAVECVTFRNNRIFNSCSFPITVRTFVETTSVAVTVGANQSSVNPDFRNVGLFFGACESPFRPVRTSGSTFECFS